MCGLAYKKKEINSTTFIHKKLASPDTYTKHLFIIHLCIIKHFCLYGLSYMTFKAKKEHFGNKYMLNALRMCPEWIMYSKQTPNILNAFMKNTLITHVKSIFKTRSERAPNTLFAGMVFICCGIPYRKPIRIEVLNETSSCLTTFL